MKGGSSERVARLFFFVFHAGQPAVITAKVALLRLY
jgi:hypothetical protein